MRQLELRLGLVLYGGVSLAIYMHGVTRELLNLQRASHALHQVRRDRERGVESDVVLEGSAKSYFDLLESFTPQLDLRVVIDAISGASAGGVNAIMLARALAHDLPLKHHSDLWLELADVDKLANEASGLRKHAKRALAPILDRLLVLLGTDVPADKEARNKLRNFISSRWFTPPFSGERFSGWLLDACRAMDEADCGETLIPFGQRLELFVTLTDFHGVLRKIALHDPEYIEELDHRRIIKFSAHHFVPNGLQSEMSRDFIPELVFAARATSSFPGAFPPMSAEEMDKVLEAQDMRWPGREKFLTNVLHARCDAESERLFIDGSLVMNKPFQPLIDSIAQRPAAREVVRRLLYLDPLPFSRGDVPSDPEAPGFFKSIFASLAHIPRNEPIGDELQEIEHINLKVRRIQEVADAALPVVRKEVKVILEKQGRPPQNEGDFSVVRESAEAASMEHSGFANAGYLQLRLGHLAHRLVLLMADLSKAGGDGCIEKEEEVQLWSWESVEKTIVKALTFSMENEVDRDQVKMLCELRTLDVDYRIRQLRFLIEQINKYYHHNEIVGSAEFARHLDVFKRELYEQIANLRNRWSEGFYGTETVQLSKLLKGVPSSIENVRTVLNVLSSRMGLADLDRLTDSLVFDGVQKLKDLKAGQEILESYIGFSFFDTSMFPVQQALDAFELRKIEVGRISPRDSPVLCPGGVELKGVQLQMFGAFFNKGWREHDYLWGRLNAAERLVRLLRDVYHQSYGADKQIAPDDDMHLRGAFLDILEEEETHLEDQAQLIESCRERVDKVFSKGC
ncbi:patatin-like protein [Pseudovibrio sp. Tun.PSC04-5.I4]|uniref:patatin-like protein n=1 Tax=Pseudovibrio sp. Tun.PSC04-5.I4 TaxID=1798213 RepID=UPI00088661D9|nr:patatin-like protein [Pseudovibrio sp. Tun.PSC04-5.I4]SDR38904.1 patatin-related protein [Pseudovibrio sp. Tun.PSC04-5.I4]